MTDYEFGDDLVVNSDGNVVYSANSDKVLEFLGRHREWWSEYKVRVWVTGTTYNPLSVLDYYGVQEAEVPDSSILPKELLQNALVEYYEPDGSRLENGMVVTLAEPTDRYEVDHKWAPVMNSWCTVRDVGISTSVDGTRVVSFIGVHTTGKYEEVPRQHPVSSGWLIKRSMVSRERMVEAKTVSRLTPDRVAAVLLDKLQGEVDMNLKALERFCKGLAEDIFNE